jgi:signal transduction histidine kinase
MTGKAKRSRAVVSALDRRGLLALGSGLLVLLVVVASSAWQSARNGRTLERVAAIQSLGTLVQNILLATEDAETGQRGFLLTDQESYLGPFNRGQTLLPALLDELGRALPADARVSVLRQAVAAKIAELQQTVDLVRRSDRAGALAVVATNAGKAEMGRIREVAAVLAREQQAELAAQSASIQAGGRLLVAIDLAGLMIVVVLAAIIGLGLRSYLATLRTAQEETANAYRAVAESNERLDETVIARTAALTSANEEIQRFAYIVSHDLRAPLVNIMGFTSELEQATRTLTAFAEAAEMTQAAREAATDDIPEALRFIRASTSKMDRLINAILKLSREGRRSLALEPLDMARLLEELVTTMRHQAIAKDVEVTVGPMPPLLADRVAAEQIFGNIVDNALKYLKPGRPGLIIISGRQEGRMACFDIADNGRGIAQRDYERVFELFRRAGDQTVPGEGIGLAHVRALVRRLGGSIDCTSTLDVGTTFTIRLPAIGITS